MNETVIMRRRTFLAAASTGLAASSGCTLRDLRSPRNDVPAGRSEINISASAWPSFHVDSANAGYHPRASGPTDAVAEQWQFAAAETDASVSELAVSETSVYVGDRANVYAIDRTDGSERWRFETGERTYGTPAIADDTVYVRVGDHLVFALAAGTGEERWRFEMERTGDSPDRSGPTVADGTVYVGGTNRTLYALDGRTGEERWGSLHGEEQGPGTVRTPAAVEKAVFVVARQNDVYALDPSDGAEQWHFEATKPGRTTWAQGAPTVAGGTVYVGVRAKEPQLGDAVDGRLYALATDDGAVRWHVDTRYPLGRNIAVDGSTVYASGSASGFGSGGELQALDPADGGRRWRVETDRGVGVPAIVEDTVYAPLTSRHPDRPEEHPFHVAAVATGDGSERWRYPFTDHGSVTTPVVVDETVYAGAGFTVYSLA